MTDYIRREDALKGVELFHCGWAEIEAVQVDYIGRLPAADVAEVVRCKDCKYVRNLGFNFGGLRHDSYFCVYNGPVSTGGDDFCSHGELQTNGGGSNDVSG